MTGCRLLAWVAPLLALTTGAELRGQTAVWRKDYAAARQEALNTGRPLILHFTTTDCPWCQRLEQITYREPTIDRALAERFIPLRIEAAQYPSLVEHLQIQGFPVIVVAGASGRIVDIHRGYLEPAAF